MSIAATSTAGHHWRSVWGMRYSMGEGVPLRKERDEDDPVHWRRLRGRADDGRHCPALPGIPGRSRRHQCRTDRRLELRLTAHLRAGPEGGGRRSPRAEPVLLRRRGGPHRRGGHYLRQRQHADEDLRRGRRPGGRPPVLGTDGPPDRPAQHAAKDSGREEHPARAHGRGHRGHPARCRQRRRVRGRLQPRVPGRRHGHSRPGGAGPRADRRPRHPRRPRRCGRDRRHLRPLGPPRPHPDHRPVVERTGQAERASASAAPASARTS